MVSEQNVSTRRATTHVCVPRALTAIRTVDVPTSTSALIQMHVAPVPLAQILRVVIAATALRVSMVTPAQRWVAPIWMSVPNRLVAVMHFVSTKWVALSVHALMDMWGMQRMNV